VTEKAYASRAGFVLPRDRKILLGCVRFWNRGGRNGMVSFLGHGMVPTLCSVRKNSRNGTVPSLCSVLEWDENGMEWNKNGIILNTIIYFLN
jgi:hypothetical protein